MVLGLVFGLAMLDNRLEIEVVRNMSYQKSDLRVPLRRLKGSTPLFFQSKLSCDVDGSPNAYHPLDDRLSLDVIDSAGGKREGGLPDGRLLVQPSPEVVVWSAGKPFIQPDGEFKGFYVSRTSLQNTKFAETDPTRYLDARKTQFMVLPGDMVPEAKVGDLAAIYDPVAKSIAYAVFGDIGPTSESGEAAMATLQRLGMPVIDGKSSPGQGRDDLFFVVFPGTASLLERADPWPHPQRTIDNLAASELEKWGGIARIESILNQDPHGGPIPDDAKSSWIFDELALLKKDGLLRTLGFSLPKRLHTGPEGRLPCAPELVWVAKEGVDAITRQIEAVEMSQGPSTSLKGMREHLHRLSEIFRQFPAATFDVGEGTLRETARCGALVERILRCGG